MQRNVDSIEGVSHDARRWTPWQTDLAYNDTKHNQLSSRSSGHPPPSRLPPALVYRQEPRPSNEDLQRAWDEYNSNLAGVFERITKGDLSNAGQSLQELSKRLLESIPELGLDTDDEKLHDARLKLWENFNHAWLGLLQAQKNMSNSDGISKQSAKLIPELVLERMGKELVELCNNIEKYGLVDYQYGVWEQEIMHSKSP
ncbi:hypothetical protein B0T11DRAFT_224485 [Plectosphaerella cucumerina]|uniref:Uncharacterized protein n=1 Tax=Plectosphaerella cucumerina TaxID=40658 RepID=A0A8K0X5M1_9PEZI|nr:hypothetical protein B0T11DRAFT_224485 [Plectosphaerella cucumerina]